MKRTSIQLLLIIVLLCYSCDCVQKLELTIQDKDTKAHIPGVVIYDTNSLVKKGFIENDDKYNYLKTVSFCTGFSLTLERAGYESKEILLEANIDATTVYLEPLKIKSQNKNPQ